VAARTEHDVRRIVRDLILELAPNPSGAAVDDPRLIDDLEYHSLGLLEVAFTLEDEFDLEPITEETAQLIQTIRDIEDHVVGELRRRGELAGQTATSPAAGA
jgi:acyl carrier protein